MLYQIRYDAGVGVTASNLAVSTFRKIGVMVWWWWWWWWWLVKWRKIARLIFSDLGDLGIMMELCKKFVDFLFGMVISFRRNDGFVRPSMMCPYACKLPRILLKKEMWKRSSNDARSWNNVNVETKELKSFCWECYFMVSSSALHYMEILSTSLTE